MIDIHSHFLPGIDDGAIDLEQSVQMCLQAAAAGCSAIVATPHQRHSRWMNTDRDELEGLLSQIHERVGSEIRLFLGAEIRIGAGLVSDLQDISHTGLCPIAGSSYLLLEFPRHRLSFDPCETIRSVRRAGWRPIVAHPEFVPGLAEDLSIAEGLVDAGALLQLTAMSITGDFGDRARSCAHKLLDRDLAHFISSDSHDTDWRQPGLKRAWLAVAARWGEETAVRLTTDNPGAVVENQDIEPLRADRVVSNLPTP